MDQENYEQYQAQEALNRQQIEGQQGVYVPQIAEQIQQAQAIIIEQTNPNKIVKEIMLVLRGEEENAKGK